MNWLERLLFSIPAIAFAAVLVLPLLLIDDTMIILLMYIIPGFVILRYAGYRIKIFIDLRKKVQCIREGTITETKIKKVYSRLSYSYRYYLLVLLENDPDYINIGTTSRFPEYQYIKGAKLRIEYAPVSNYIFSVNVVRHD